MEYAEGLNDSALQVTLEERGGTHGSFADNGLICQTLRAALRTSPNWRQLLPAQQLALDEMTLKMARLLSAGADPLATEHWHDIAGYALLAERAALDGRNTLDKPKG